MSIELIDERELYEALRPFRPDRRAFERGVQDYLRGRAALAEQDPARDLPPLARAAAAVLPLPLLTGKAGAPAAATGLLQKLFGALLLPAVSFFLLVGATFFSYSAVRNTKRVGDSEPRNVDHYQAAIRSWWSDHRLAAFLVWGVALLLMVMGATDWLFYFFIVSFAFVVAVVRSLAARGLGNRQLLAGSLLLALMMLAQCTSSFSIGDGNIHFLDQRLVSIPFWLGVVFMVAAIAQSPAVEANRTTRQARLLGLVAVVAFPLMIWQASSILWITTPASIRRHVEAFDRAPNHTVSWQQWEIPARWAIEDGLNPDVSKPRALFAREIAGKQNSLILSIGFRTGLARREQISQLKNFESYRESLLHHSLPEGMDRSAPLFAGPILSLDQFDWVVRAMMLDDQLAAADRDYLAGRLHATIAATFTNEYGTISEILIATLLLDAIDRPVQPDQYRARIHELLLQRHTTASGGFALAGGFRKYGKNEVLTADPDTTADAVELMQIYGVPEGLDLNWVRSYAKPRPIGLGLSNRWTSAVTRERLAAIPGVEPPTLWQWLYYERNLLAAVILVGLCIYAVWISPVAQPTAQQPT